MALPGASTAQLTHADAIRSWSQFVRWVGWLAGCDGWCIDAIPSSGAFAGAVAAEVPADCTQTFGVTMAL